MKKILVLLSALALSACSSNTTDALQEQRQFAADIDAIGSQAQTDYFACRFVRHLWHCRDEIWQKQPKPHMPPAYNQREFLERYLDAVERRGARNVLKAENQPCGEVTSLDSFFWREGQEAICSDGNHYQIERLEGKWRISRINGGA